MEGEKERHQQLMDFMLEFKTSMEAKLETKLDVINGEIRTLKDTIDGNDAKTEDAMTRMDVRLKELEKEMKRSSILGEERRKLVGQEKEVTDQTIESEEKDMAKLRKKKNKQFERCNIEHDDLERDIGIEEHSPFRSTWVKSIEDELSQAAKMTVKTRRDKQTETVRDKEPWSERQDKEMERTDFWVRQTVRNDKEKDMGKDRQEVNARKIATEECRKTHEDDLEDLVRKKKKTPLVRKPIIAKQWFCEEYSESDSDSSQGEEPNQWTEIERKKRNLIKKKEQKQKLIQRKENIATRMKHMVGVGPIPQESISHFEKTTKNPNEARIEAIKEYLRYYLKYDTEELNDLNFMETKRAAKDDVIYFALSDQSDIREIYFRRASSGNDDLCVRDYIPPHYHGRYKVLTNKASVLREQDNTLKTQVRWGDKDVEIWTKRKGSDERYRKIDIKEFMGDTPLPEFDAKIKWTQRKEEKTRRKPVFGEENPVLPSLAAGRREMEMARQSLVRMHSAGNREETAKRRKQNKEDTEQYEEHGDISNMEDENVEEEL